MKALMSVEPGGPETLKLVEMETPAPPKGGVLIRVHAAGCNFPDTLIIRDLYQFRPERPFAPGGEVAGVVEAVGEGVDPSLVGKRVAASAGAFGGYATHVIVKADAPMPIPDAMSFEEAAAFIMTYGTSYYALKDRAKLASGEVLVVLGAAGGVGSAAVELGKAMGAKVVACASSEAKAAFCRELGADETIVYSIGTLYGAWPDRTPFEGNRYVDRFVVKDGRIVKMDVWNDSAERILTARGIEA